MKIKLGILGCGMIGRSFIEQIIAHSFFDVVAINFNFNYRGIADCPLSTQHRLVGSIRKWLSF